MKLSIILPTYNNEKTIYECLKSIDEQSLSKEDYEILIVDGRSTDKTREIAKKFKVKIIDNPKRVEEAARIKGLKIARGEIIALIDADNVLMGKDWLKKMLEPFKDKEIAFADTLYFSLRKKDPMKVRYQALIGGDDPLVNYLGFYSRWCYFKDNWTDEPYAAEKQKGYFKVKFKDKELVPAMGSNGFLVRKNILKKFVKNSFIHSDIIYDMVNNNYNCFAKVDGSIVHNQQTFFKNKIRRIQRRMKKEVNIKYNYGLDNKKVTNLLLRSILVLPIAYDVIRGFTKKPDSAWLFHFPALYGLIGIQTFYKIRALLKLK